ncbi:MAG: DNA cytosine methyltransferase [Armatimonadetes bacterium]|nr:DNA cytosine methyltransferase [Armatimonadota bacterium]
MQLGHYGEGTAAPWYRGWSLTEEESAVFRARSAASREAKRRAMRGEGPPPLHDINVPRLDPADLMPQLPPNGLRALSVFSGGGGFDLGFMRAGYEHLASCEILTHAGLTLKRNRSDWNVLHGHEGDVRAIDWKAWRDRVDVLHGGPPCQPFSMAGRRMGPDDTRDLFPVYVNMISTVRPVVFVAENVPALASGKFREYVQNVILRPLQRGWRISMFKLSAESVGIPQTRTRLFFVGVRRDVGRTFEPPAPAYTPMPSPYEPRPASDLLVDFVPEPPYCMGAREALGLTDIGVDGPAPTLRSGLTGPRHTTSVLSSVSALRKWNTLQIWPNGIAASREAAHAYIANNGHFRLSVDDCALLQGFPAWWKFEGAVYMVLGQIGNSVVPPMAWQLARSVAQLLSR